MRLKIINAIQSEIGHRVPMRHTPMMNITKLPDTRPEKQFDHNVSVEFMVRIGAKVVCPDQGDAIDEARKRTAQMICREIFGDLTEELIALQWFAYQEGFGKELDDKIGRIILLAQGREVLE